MSTNDFPKIVIAIASSALFDLSDSDRVFQERGEAEYQKFQQENLETVLGRGVAFPFVKRLLTLNEAFPEIKPVEVILLSRNSHETGQRVFKSIGSYGLNIHKAAFFRGETPYKYIPAFGASLFLSANEEDVRNAIAAGFPAGRVVKTEIKDEEDERQLRIAFDFDGVAASDEAEKVYESDGLLGFYFSETTNSEKAHNPGPINNFVKQLMMLRGLESEKEKQDPGYRRILDLAFITARDAPAHERMINTIKSWGGEIDKSFFLGGTPKKKILETLSPHIYFDDQERNFDDVHNIPLVHIPFGVKNKNQ